MIVKDLDALGYHRVVFRCDNDDLFCFYLEH